MWCHKQKVYHVWFEMSNIHIAECRSLIKVKGAGTFHSAGQSKEGYVGFGTSEHPIFMKLLPDHLWH